MAFLLSNFLAACRLKPESEFKPQISSTSNTHMTTKKGAGNEAAENMITELLRIHGRLDAIGADHLKPCEEVNLLFGQLVGLCTRTASESVTYKVLNDSRIVTILPSLHQLCAISECHLESYWARHISTSEPSLPSESATSSQAYDRLRAFPYYSNYTDLTRMELSAIFSLSNQTDPTHPSLRKFAFIGSGPLPLTSLCIYQTAQSFNLTQPIQRSANPLNPPPSDNNAIEVLNIDINPEAIAESKKLCDLLGPSASGMTFQCSPADSPKLDLRSFDVVYLAALVGSTQAEKEILLESVVGRMSEGAVLVIRSAERLRRLLYPEFDPTTEKVLNCLEICLAVHPYNHVVNSVIIGKVRGKTAPTALQ